MSANLNWLIISWLIYTNICHYNLTTMLWLLLKTNCSQQWNKSKKRPAERCVTQINFSNFCTPCWVLFVRSIVPWTNFYYITPDGSLAPPLICNMFMGPASTYARACRRWLFDLSPLQGPLGKGDSPRARPAFMLVAEPAPGLMRNGTLRISSAASMLIICHPRAWAHGSLRRPLKWTCKYLCTAGPGITSVGPQFQTMPAAAVPPGLSSYS